MKILLSSLLIVINFTLSTLGIAQSKYPDFQVNTFEYEGETMPFRWLEPMGFQSKQTAKYPLLICLHGAGERGTDNEITLTHFAPWLLKPANRTQYPCFVLVPQCDKNFRWLETDWTLDKHTQPENMSKYMNLLVKLLADIEKKYPIDTQRIYVTGLSMGGFGTWDIACRLPDKFAAIVPVCGGGDENIAYKIKNIPIWAFHGGLDKLVKTSRSQNMIRAIEAAGGKPKYTEYPQVAHDSWKPAYQEPTLLQWIFSQRKK